jgi:hypothetical protein
VRSNFKGSIDHFPKNCFTYWKNLRHVANNPKTNSAAEIREMTVQPFYTFVLLGELSTNQVQQIYGLSNEQLEALGKALFDFREEQELLAWLERSGV